MALIRQASRDQVAKDAIVLHLGDLVRQGDSLKEQAVGKARDVIREAHAERTKLLEGAKEEGFASGKTAGFAEGLKQGTDAGFKQALAEGKERCAGLERAWKQQLVELIANRDALYASAHEDVLTLALAIAEKVIKRTVEVDKEVASRQIQAVLSSLAAPTRLVILVHTDDQKVVEEMMPEIIKTCSARVHVELQVSESVSRGSCIAKMAREMGGAGGVGGEIDASIEVQIQRIAAAIMPGTVGDGGGER